MTREQLAAELRRYLDAGFRCIPVDADKRPAVDARGVRMSWEGIREATATPTVDDVLPEHLDGAHGVAVLPAHSGLQVLDFDQKHYVPGEGQMATLVEEWGQMMLTIDPAYDIDAEYVVATPSGGHHVYVFVDAPEEPNQKLAKAADGQVVIETRGWNGYVCAPPTPGYVVAAGTLSRCRRLSGPQWGAYKAAARSMDESPAPTVYVAPVAPVAPVSVGDGLRPGDDYDAKTDAVDLLRSLGWTVVGQRGPRVHMKRPGDTNAASSGNYHAGHGLFYSFTTSTPLPSDKGLTPFAIHAHYHHAGDFAAAAKDLAAKGFGESRQTATKSLAPLHSLAVTPAPADADAEIEAATVTRNPGRVREFWLYVNGQQVAGPGKMGIVSGREKSGKSTLSTALVASAVSGYSVLNVALKLPDGRKDIVWVDTEQPLDYAERTQDFIAAQARIGDAAIPNFRQLLLSDKTPAESMTLLTRLVERDGARTGVIILDGTLDLIPNYNDIEQSQALVKTLRAWTKRYGFMLVCVHHLGKGNNQLLGTVGSVLARKVDFNLQVVAEGSEREVTSHNQREKPFAPYSWRWGDNGLPELIGHTSARSIPATVEPLRNVNDNPFAPMLQSRVNTDDEEILF